MRVRNVLVVGSWLLTLAVGGCAGRDADPAERGPEKPPVVVVKPAREDVVRSLTLPGDLVGWYQATLYAKVSGYLKWIGPDKGDAVKKDQVLAIIDAPEVEEQYHQALSDYHIKKLTFDRLAKVWKESPDVIAKQDVDVAEAASQGAKQAEAQNQAAVDQFKSQAALVGGFQQSGPEHAMHFDSGANDLLDDGIAFEWRHAVARCKWQTG